MARHLSKVHFDTNDAIELPVGTTAQRPSSPVAGMFRYNSTDGQFEGYTTEWGAIAGGGGTVTIEKNVYTGDGSDVTFDTTTAIANENNVQIYLDGVYQSKDNYTTSGSTVTFSTAPPNGVSVELIHILSAETRIIRDVLTANGSTTAFSLTAQVTDENHTQVYIDGIYQSKDNYTTLGSTITFSSAPGNGSSIEVINIKPINTNQLAAGTILEEQLSATNSPVDGYVLTYDSTTTGFTWEEKLADDAVTIAKIADAAIVTESEGIGSNDNDTTLPTSAAVKDFVDTSIANADSGGISWQSSFKTSNFTAVAGEGYFLDTSSATVIVTLPSSPSVGNEVHLVDATNSSATNPIEITSSDKINSSTATHSIYYNRGAVSLVYSGSVQGWVAYNAANETRGAIAEELNFNVNYLVVAGGGAGAGFVGGGGGAGGLRTSYGSSSGGGQSAESAISVSTLGTYTVTVGAGGTPGQTPTNGGNSVFSTITSIGGGIGGAAVGGYGVPGASSGGSGGGGGGAAVTSPVVHGFAGGANGSGCNLVSCQAAGGGGGASAAGTAGVSGPNNYQSGQSQSGDGGDGLSVTILSASNANIASVGQVSGSNVYYAGGGGGGDWGGSSATDGDGGLGGGASYGATTGNEPYGSPGTTNTGGGGSGVGYVHGTNSQNNNAGGSGVVILRFSNLYEATQSAGLTMSTYSEGSDTVAVFTAGTGTITFSQA